MGARGHRGATCLQMTADLIGHVSVVMVNFRTIPFCYVFWTLPIYPTQSRDLLTVRLFHSMWKASLEEFLHFSTLTAFRQADAIYP